MIATLRPHHAQLVLHAEQRTEHVGVEGGRVAVGGLLGHRAGLAFGAGGIDGHIQTAKARDGFVDQAAHIVFVAHIGPYKFRFRAEFAELVNQLLAFFVAPTGNNNLCAFLGKREGRRPSDACQSSCNQNNLSIH